MVEYWICVIVCLCVSVFSPSSRIKLYGPVSVKRLVLNAYFVYTVLATLNTTMFHTYVADAALSTAPSYSDFRGTTFIDDDDSNSLTSQI